MRSTVSALFLLALAYCAGCDEGSTVCGANQVMCDGQCVSGNLCVATLPTGTGGGTGAPTVVTPVDPGPFTSADCTDTSTTAGSFSSQYAGTNITTGNGKSYFLHTNWWYLYQGQTVDYQGLSFTVKNPQNAASAASDGNPMGYPSLFIGSYAGHTTSSSNLPKQVSALTTVPTVFSTTAADGSIANHNAAYDVWFTDTSAPLSSGAYSPPPGGAFLMVWMFKPTSRQPRGSLLATAQTIPGVEGQWNVWVDGSSPPCISYVSVTPRNGLAFDLNNFIKDSVTHKYGITNSMYLSVVFAGLEIWGGGDGIQVRNFCAKVN